MLPSGVSYSICFNIYVWHQKKTLKNHCCKTSDKCPLFWLELPWLKILKESQRSLKKFKDLERLQNFEDFNTVLRPYSGKIMVVSVLDLWVLQSVSKEKLRLAVKAVKASINLAFINVWSRCILFIMRKKKVFTRNLYVYYHIPPTPRFTFSVSVLRWAIEVSFKIVIKILKICNLKKLNNITRYIEGF